MSTAVAQSGFRHAHVSLGAMVTTTERGLAGILKNAGHALGHWSLPLAAGGIVVAHATDKHLADVELRDRFKDEVAVIVGKSRREITTDDVRRVAAHNPILKEKLDHNTTERNLGIATAIAGVAAGIAIAAALAPVLAPVILGAAPTLFAGAASAVNTVLVPLLGSAVGAEAMAHLAVGGIAGGLAFLGIESKLEKVGAKKLGLDRPELREVKRNPNLQSKLLVADQIAFLEEQQKEGRKITSQQVATVFASARPKEQINPEAVAKLTDDINNGKERVQELAFAAYGQSSGARAEAEKRQHIAELYAQLTEHYAKGLPERSAMAAQEARPGKHAARYLAERQQRALSGAVLG